MTTTASQSSHVHAQSGPGRIGGLGRREQRQVAHEAAGAGHVVGKQPEVEQVPGGPQRLDGERPPFHRTHGSTRRGVDDLVIGIEQQRPIESEETGVVGRAPAAKASSHPVTA